MVRKSDKKIRVREHWLSVFIAAAQKDSSLGWAVKSELNETPLLLGFLPYFTSRSERTPNFDSLPNKENHQKCTEHDDVIGLRQNIGIKGVNDFNFVVKSLGLNGSYCAY